MTRRRDDERECNIQRRAGVAFCRLIFPPIVIPSAGFDVSPCLFSMPFLNARLCLNAPRGTQLPRTIGFSESPTLTRRLALSLSLSLSLSLFLSPPSFSLSRTYRRRCALSPFSY